MADLLRAVTRPDDDPLEPTVEAPPLLPLAVVIVTDKNYLTDPTIEGTTLVFYSQICDILESRGFRLEFDPGAPYTSPSRDAAVWIGHDRGAERFHRAPKTVRCIRLQTMAAFETFPSMGVKRLNEANYTLSPQDLEVLNALEP